jgi:nitrate/nitrite-specific signal transduction histidine kinase
VDDSGGLRDLRRLRLVGVLAPVVFLAGFEVVRLGVIDAVLEEPASNVAAGAVAVAAALGFGLLLFFHIDRAQRTVVLRNRDLAVVNGVAAASQGELDVNAAVPHALAYLVDHTAIVEAGVTVGPLEPDAGPGRDWVHAPPARVGDALAGPTAAVTLPLTASGTHIGQLRLVVPAAGSPDVPSAAALRMIADQLATTIHIGQLVDDLHSRRADGHVFYQALVQTSNQAPLAACLGTIMEGARDRLAADQARICLTRGVLDALELESDVEAGLTDGIVCHGPELTAHGSVEERVHLCAIGTEAHVAASIRAPLWASGELVGDLWVARREGPQFTDRDRRYLMTLAGIATIAVTSARARQLQRHGAVLAERDRIARELHDSLAQVLGSTHLRLRYLVAGGKLDDKPAVNAELVALADVAEEAYRDVREAILGLRETSRPRDFLEAVQAYVDKYALLSGIDVQLECSTARHPSGVGGEIQVLRVIQEALTNVRKHAQARSVRIRITDCPGESMQVVIEDDGRGFDPNAVGVHRDGGYGLETMRERMELAGGSFRIESMPNAGTRVTAVLPGSTNGRPAVILPDHR